MHIDDAHDDKLVAEETAFHAHTRAQTRTADAAKVLDDPFIPTTSSNDQTEKSIQILVIPTNVSSKHAPTRATNEIAPYDDLSNHNELAIVRAFLRHLVEFVLPPHYRPDAVGEMHIIGVDTKKLTKTTAVEFLTPKSLNDYTMQIYCTSLEPKRGLSQGADLSILTAVKSTPPQAKSLYDIVFGVMPAVDITKAMLADFDSIKGGSVWHHPSRLSWQWNIRAKSFQGHNLRSVRDPIGYTRAIPDPKHHGQAMCSLMRIEWIKSQGLEMQGMWSWGVFQKVWRTSLIPQDRVFSTCFHYKIKRKGGESDQCKVRLVVQGQHTKHKGADGFGDYDDALSPVPAASGFCTILSRATQVDMLYGSCRHFRGSSLCTRWTTARGRSQ